MIPRRIDLNADVGEGVGQDPDLLPLVTSANIACGGHAGDEATMQATVALAREHGVAIGAHPSFPDREGFGRRTMTLSAEEVEACVLEQVRVLADIAAAQGMRLQHVKPHGALYNVAARDAMTAASIARAIRALDPGLILVGLAGSELIRAGFHAGLRTASEVFADRAFRADGTLVPRDEPGSVLDDPEVVLPRVVAMVREAAVAATDGSRVPVQIDTICVHGDTPDAAALAARIRRALLDAGIELAPMGAA